MSSSSDLETGITQQILQKKSNKSKKKSKPTPALATDNVVTDHGRNEGDDPHWAYKPPEGAVLLDHAVDVGAFEWGAVKDDDDTEIWLIRVPDTLTAKHLKGLEIDLPSSSRTGRIGGLTRKTASYDIWSVSSDDGDDADLAGGEDLRGLTCLLPRKRKKGKLYIAAPKKVSRHIIVSARPSVATAPEDQPVVYQNPPRQSYPKHVLEHAFVPYGARRSEQIWSGDPSMDVDEIETAQDKPASGAAPPHKEKPAKTKESKGKKRKVEGDFPKRSKKHKSDA